METSMNSLTQHTEKILEDLYPTDNGDYLVSKGMISQIIQETLSWAEEQVVPEEIERKWGYGNLLSGDVMGFNRCRAQIITRFKEIQGL